MLVTLEVSVCVSNALDSIKRPLKNTKKDELIETYTVAKPARHLVMQMQI